MRLSELTGVQDQAQAIEILGLAADSRQVKPGYLFAALAGTKTDGAKYIDQAVAKGAVAVLMAPGAASFPAASKVCQITAANPGQRFAELAARFYGLQPKYIVAVTGTNGKTSVASFTRQIWGVMGYQAASIGTLGIVAPGYMKPPSLTTPDPITLHGSMKDLASLGIDHVAMEASSHGLAQYRLDGIKLKAAAFTNLTRDHMDYHGGEEAYFYAKARLFGEVMAPGGVAVLNRESPCYSELENLCWARGHRVLAVGVGDGNIRLMSCQPVAAGQHLIVNFQARTYDINLPLAGNFQAMNALIAAGLVIGCGGDAARVFKALEELEPVPGRLQKVAALSNGATIYVDYAHTPDALATILQALEPHAAGDLWVVFGCGGDRDRGKRPLMGEIAARLAGHVVVTDDNPRSENPADIRRQILTACSGAEEIADRRDAIRTAIAALKAGDVLVVAGKGHEEGQIIGAEIRPFSDVDEVRSAVRRREEGGHHA